MAAIKVREANVWMIYHLGVMAQFPQGRYYPYKIFCLIKEGWQPPRREARRRKDHQDIKSHMSMIPVSYPYEAEGAKDLNSLTHPESHNGFMTTGIGQGLVPPGGGEGRAVLQRKEQYEGSSLRTKLSSHPQCKDG